MYVVIRGATDSLLGETDFNVHGPFATATSARAWIDEVQNKFGEDPLDEPIVLALYAPTEIFEDTD
jgi:hypothetical protein